MKVYHEGAVYDFTLSREESREVVHSGIETDLLDLTTRQSTEKKISLYVGEPEFRNADIEMTPEGASWDDATSMRVTVEGRYIHDAQMNGHSSVRLAYGDAHFHVEG